MQAATTSTMRAGLYAQEIVGIGLNSTERQTVRVLQASAEALAQAIREAMARARSTGLDAFAPDSATLNATLSATGLSSAQLRTLFAVVIGHPYSAAYESADQLLYPGLPDHGALTLAQWSQAVQALEVEVARQGSLLPPGEGGGMRHALGQWYVNGERYTLAELFLTLRMGNVTETDKALETDLNTLLANTNLARELLAVLADMKRRRDLKVAAVVPPASAPTGFSAATAAQFNARTDFQAFVEASKLSLSELMGYGTRFKGTDSSSLQSLGTQALANSLVTGNVLANDSSTNNSLSVSTFMVAGVTGSFSAGTTATIPNVGTLRMGADGAYEFRPAATFYGQVPTIHYTTNNSTTNIKSGSTPFLSISVGPEYGTSLLSPHTRDIAAGTATVTGNVTIDAMPVSSFTIAGVSGSFPASTDSRTVPGFGSIVLEANGNYTYTKGSGTGTVPTITYTTDRGLSSTLSITVAPSTGLLLAADDKTVVDPTVDSAAYGFAMDELQALFDSVNAENQVKRLKVQSVQNARTAMLEGMSAFLNSTSTQNNRVERNL